MSLVVIGGTVITENDTRQMLSPGAVAIDGSDIVEVDTPAAIAARYNAAQTIDARDQVVLPGLINTHTHAPMVMFRGLADDLALMDWLQRYIFPAEAKTVSPDFVRTGTRLAALEMIESGTTTYADMYYFEDEIAKATKEAGLRGVLGQTVIQFPVADARTPAEGLARAEAFIQQFKNDPLIVPAVAPHAMYTLDAATLQATAALGRKLRRAGADPPGGDARRGEDGARRAPDHARRLPRVDRLLGTEDAGGARRLGEPTTDIAILKTHDVGVSHNPESNMKLASGAAPVLKYLAAGVNARRSAPTAPPATTTSTCSRRCARRRSSPSCRRAVPRLCRRRWRSTWRPSAVRRRWAWTALIGSLEPGKRADLITVSMTCRTAGADVRRGVAPGLRHARRRCAQYDRERQGADARPPPDAR